MEQVAPSEIDIQRLLEALRPPEFPDEAFHATNVNLRQIVSWKKNVAVSVLAGLLTEPQFHANGVRLDWLQRLVLSKSGGRRKPSSTELSSALNAGLEEAKVLRLEDPNEDLFCDLIVTRRGNFRIFTGLWEGAVAYTQTLLDAFEALPTGRLKNQTLTSVYALLRLSDELAARANVSRFTASGGDPKGIIALPNAEGLKQLARRVRFTDGELEQLDISRAALSPFLLAVEQLSFISDRPAGDTPLEFYPLLANPNAILVASPANISLAVRAVLVVAAQRGGLDDALLSAMLVEQQKFSELSGFWPVPSLQFSAPNPFFMRASVCQFAQGRFLHVIQVPATFDQFPEQAFGSVRELGAEASRLIADDISRFWQFLRRQTDFRQGISVLLLSGWGTPHSVAPPIDEANVPPNWIFLPLGFSDAAVMGACEDGKFRNIVRILQQEERLETDGFTFKNMSGLLNLFGFWHTTGGNLIPEHLWEIEPPCNLMLPTDELLAPRIEAAKKRDFRALPLAEGGYKTVQRLDWGDIDDLQPIYASPEDATQGRLAGAVSIEGRVWWIECSGGASQDREWQYRTWHAVLQWLAVVGHNVIEAFPDAYPVGAAHIEFAIPAAPAFESIDPTASGDSDLTASLTGSRASGGRPAQLRISSSWLGHLVRPENDAEVEMIAAILEQIAISQATSVSREQLADIIRASIGSRDWRWLHAREAFTPVDRMAASGLLGPFKQIPFSATSLVKCRSVWSFRNRSEGLEISGEDECRDFLGKYRDSLLGELISQLRTMDRVKLMVLCADRYQAARAEQAQWRSTIRAMRAIHGASADTTAFKRQNAINAVQRAAKSVCEVAACEAPLAGGLDPGQIDLEEMFARALLVFGNGQLFASIRAGIIEPKLRISPAGDLLSDRSVHEILLPAVEWMNRRALDEAAEAYPRNRRRERGQQVEERLPWNEDRRRAVEAEYRTSSEAFFDLQYAIIQIAETRNEGTFTIRRSELAALLASNDGYPSLEPSPLLERLTLPRRSSWTDTSCGFSEADIDLSRFDRRFSIINRPLVAIDDEVDPLLLVAPIFVSDGTMYSLSGLMNGSLNNNYWNSNDAKIYAGMQGNAAGLEFEDSVADRLRGIRMEAWSRCKLSWALNEKVDPQLGDIDVLALSPNRHTVWVIEAKNLRLCRTEAEVASRLSDYRGKMVRDNKGREKPDKMLRHIRRVHYLRERRSALCKRLKLDAPPEVRGLLIVDAPQPMNFYSIGQLEDGQSVFLGAIDSFNF